MWREAMTIRGTAGPDAVAAQKQIETHEAAHLPALELRLDRLMEKIQNSGSLPISMTQSLVVGPVKDPGTHIDLAQIRVPFRKQNWTARQSGS